MKEYRGKKNCTKCGKYRSVIDFCMRWDKGFLNGECKYCYNKARRQWYKKNYEHRNIDICHLIRVAQEYGWTTKDIANNVGVSDRNVRRWKNGQKAQLAQADRFCIALGTCLSLVYSI